MTRHHLFQRLFHSNSHTSRRLPPPFSSTSSQRHILNLVFGTSTTISTGATSISGLLLNNSTQKSSFHSSSLSSSSSSHISISSSSFASCTAASSSLTT